MEKVKENTKIISIIISILLFLAILLVIVFLSIKEFESSTKQLLVSIVSSVIATLTISLVLNIYFTINITRISVAIDQSIDVKVRDIYNIEHHETKVVNEPNDISQVLVQTKKDSRKILKLISNLDIKIKSELDYFNNTRNNQKQLNIEILELISQIYEVGDLIVSNTISYRFKFGDRYKKEIKNKDAIRVLNSLSISVDNFINEMKKSATEEQIKAKFKIVEKKEVDHIQTTLEIYKEMITDESDEIRAFNFYE